MTDAELVREIAQPLTDQSGDYDALNQSGARYAHALPKSRDCGTKRKRVCHDFARSAFGVRCASHRFSWPMSKSKGRTTR